VVAQASNFSFDAFTFECWAALTSGASIAVLAKDTVLNHAELKAALKHHEISTIWLTASLFNQHVRDCPDLFAGLKTVLYGGEAVDRSAADDLVTGPHAPGRLVNGYGPTETTTFAACHIVTGTDGLPTMPIGRPIANTTLYVMDPHGEPAPLGVPGELWIGGPGVARGYWNRPELTAEKFVQYNGDHVYRTGDLVRWLPGQVLEFRGRIDQQVKVRGLRIELGEIETTLAGHPGITTAAVVVREDTPGDRRLVAYCTGEAADLRTWCRQSLPDYMIPSAFVFVGALPLTANGKLDQQALPAPDGERLSEDHAAPRTELEEAIAGVWSDILGVGQVGIHDDFFALGGHSLLATRVTNRVGLVTGTEVSLKQFFLAPTVAALAAELTQAKASSARLLPREAGVWQTELSFAQRRLWFLDQLDPGSSEYVVPCAFRLSGPLHVGSLEAAFSGVVARHEVLRTRFVTGPDGEPRQVIDEPWAVRITEIDLRDRPYDAQSVIDIEAVRPFDLTSGRLFRVMLVQTADQEHVLLVSMHHIVTDGWSVEILGRELRDLYEGSGLTELPVQYADFALWQNEWLSGSVLDQQLAYWRDRLAGLEPLELPTDHPRPAMRSSSGGGVQFTVPADVASKLRDLAARHRTSLFTVGLSALMVVLARHSGRHDIGVGTSIAGRTRHEIEDLVGFFVNTLVMRADLSGAPSFDTLLEQVKATALDAYAHQDLPFERLVEEFAPERDLSRNPLFGVEFAINQVFEWTLPGLAVTPIDVTPLTAKFDLSVTLTEKDGGELRGDAVFATALFDESTIAGFAEHFVAVLSAVAADPRQDVSRIELLTAAERAELADLQGTATLTSRVPVHKAVQAQAANTPDAIAVVCGANTLSYRELNAEANQLARHLRELGVRRGGMVAVCLNRGVDMIVALLAVLKSGAAYVPIDPELPVRRKEFVLADTGAHLVVTESGLGAGFSGAVQVLLDEDRADIEAWSDAGMPTHSGPEDLAYVIYTSGSTGTPKGVMIEHRSLAARVHEMRDRYLLSDRDRVLQFASITFDAAAEQIFPALMSGASLVLRDSENWTPSRILSLIRDEQVTVAELTPALWEQVIPHLETGGLGEGFRLLVLGGDQVTPAAVADWFARTGVPIYNTYGPTEATITATAGVILAPVDTVSIGRPISETEVFVMDRNGNLAPRGVPGELWIGGVGVARGYLNRPELTAEKFVEFNGQRVYRTGDLVRWLPNGDLEFLGRIDRQVKLRGLRIELGEIEAVLTGHVDVSSATVIVREDSPGDKRLVAYYVADEDVDLRTWCRQSLPGYMVPSAFVPLDALPLTSSGKIDRTALPAPTGTPVTDVDYVAPRSEFERIIAELWAEVLGVTQVGVHDNFFALGGHSLLATRVVNKIELLTGLTVSLKQFFLAPTVEALGRQVVELFELEAPHDHD
jgi:amino acid adenylation domain-containing protein